MPKKRFLTAQQAAERLDVKVSTLYAYVSRGWLRSEHAGGNSRERQYYAEDVDRLRERREGRRDPESVAASALHVGSPVLESAITQITDNAPYYRGHNALDLARTHPIEAVAGLIWLDDLNASIPGLAHYDPAESIPAFRPFLADLHVDPLAALQVTIPFVGDHDLGAYDLSRDAVIRSGARCFRTMLRTLVGPDRPMRAAAETLANAWDCPEHASLIDGSLVVCADHELNTSTFAARCAASVDATPYAVVSAGLAAFQGPRHGGSCRKAEAFLSEIRSDGSARRVIAEWLRRGERVPGFGHVLYRDVDPRARLLLDAVEAAFPDLDTVSMAREVCENVEQDLELYCNLDFGLAAVSDALRLERGTAGAIFALGRCIGWIGHAIEQFDIRPIIRPRARYVGRLPEENVDFSSESASGSTKSASVPV